MKGKGLQTLEELGLSSLVGWNNSISDWLYIGLADISCNSCEIFCLAIAPTEESLFPSEYRFICVSCLVEKRFVDYSISQQNSLSDKFAFILEDGVEKYSSESLRTFHSFSSLFGGLTKKFEKSSPDAAEVQTPFSILAREIRGNEDAPIPKGFRSISWIRFYEAEAIIHAYKSKSDFELKSDSMAVVLKCLYFPDDSDERRKFKANVQAIRVNNQNQRVIGWIRLEEARAVVEANTSRKDVDFAHLKFGNGGKVQFFPEELEVAKKYRSTTRLLRKD
jgi:hypothetical protein